MHFLLHLIVKYTPGFSSLPLYKRFFYLSAFCVGLAGYFFWVAQTFFQESVLTSATVISRRIEKTCDLQNSCKETIVPTYRFRDSHNLMITAEENSYDGGLKDAGTSKVRPFEVGEIVPIRFKNDNPLIATSRIQPPSLKLFSVGLPLGFAFIFVMYGFFCMKQNR